MADAHVLARDVGAQAAGDQRRVLRQRDVHPAARIQRVRAGERHVRVGLGQMIVLLAGDLLQPVLSVASARLAAITVAAAVSWADLGLLHVGDGDESDLEALVGLVELSGDRLQRRLIGLEQCVIGRQHHEVGGGDAQDQVLLGGLVGRLGLRHLLAGRLDLHPVGPGEQVRAQVQRPGLGGGVDRLGQRHDDQAGGGWSVGADLG